MKLQRDSVISIQWFDSIRECIFALANGTIVTTLATEINNFVTCTKPRTFRDTETYKYTFTLNQTRPTLQLNTLFHYKILLEIRRSLTFSLLAWSLSSLFEMYSFKMHSESVGPTDYNVHYSWLDFEIDLFIQCLQHNDTTHTHTSTYRYHLLGSPVNNEKCTSVTRLLDFFFQLWANIHIASCWRLSKASLWSPSKSTLSEQCACSCVCVWCLFFYRILLKPNGNVCQIDCKNPNRNDWSDWKTNWTIRIFANGQSHIMDVNEWIWLMRMFLAHRQCTHIEIKVHKSRITGVYSQYRNHC